jgi:hypothetical protein
MLSIRISMFQQREVYRVRSKISFVGELYRFDVLSYPSCRLRSRVSLRIAHASRVLKIPVTIVKTPRMRLIFVSAERLRGNRSAGIHKSQQGCVGLRPIEVIE